MPIHDSLTYLSAGGLAAAAWAVQVDPLTIGVATAAHVVSGVLFSPDLDLDNHARAKWGALWVLWAPYAVIIPHRSILSHGFVIGPLLRLLYFCLVLFVPALFALLYWQVDIPLADLPSMVLTLISEYPTLLIAFLLGWCSGGAIHTLADYATGEQ